MVQGNIKLGKKPGASKSGKSAKVQKRIVNQKKVLKGNPKQLPNNAFRNEALDDRALSRAIDKSNEQKVAAKFLQGGGKLLMTDLTQKGKEMNKDIRRSQVKKKLGRVEEKLKELEKKQIH